MEDFDNVTTNIGQIYNDFTDIQREIDYNAMDITSVNITVDTNVKTIDTYHPKHRKIGDTKF